MGAEREGRLFFCWLDRLVRLPWGLFLLPCTNLRSPCIVAGRTAAHLEDGVQVGVLLVSADLVEGEEGQHPARLLPGAPLFQQLLDRERKTDFSV